MDGRLKTSYMADTFKIALNHKLHIPVKLPHTKLRHNTLENKGCTAVCAAALEPVR